MKFKSNVRAAMGEVGFRELCRLSGVTTDTLRRAVDDSRLDSCTLKVLGKIADALGCSVKDLFDDLPDEATKKDAE